MDMPERDETSRICRNMSIFHIDQLEEHLDFEECERVSECVRAETKENERLVLGWVRSEWARKIRIGRNYIVIAVIIRYNRMRRNS